MIRCISRYSSSLGSFEPGQVISDAKLVASLLVDSPGSFELAEEPKQAEPVSGAEHQDIPLVSKPARGFRRKG